MNRFSLYLAALVSLAAACGSDTDQPAEGAKPSQPSAAAPSPTKPAEPAPSSGMTNPPAMPGETPAQPGTSSGMRSDPAGAAAGSAAPAPSTPAAMGGMTKPATQGPIPTEFMGDAGDGWSTLIAGKWEVPAGQETYHCVRFTLPKTVAVQSFRALAPSGTHHTLLTLVDDSPEPDGGKACNAGTNGRRSITGSGVGSNDFVLPEGVAMKIEQGQQLLLNLHLFNVTDKPITGTSGSLMKLIDEANVKQYAEGILAGQTMLSIPVGGPTKQSGECSMTHDSTLFAVSPHMHQLGVHLKAVARSSMAGEVVLYDGPYSFDEQLVYPLKQQVAMKKGDKISVECTYQNTTDKPVKFGESSLSEMCFAGVYRYPAGAPGFVCTR